MNFERRTSLKKLLSINYQSPRLSFEEKEGETPLEAILGLLIRAMEDTLSVYLVHCLNSRQMDPNKVRAY